MRISINSITANAVREEVYNGRNFVILNAMLIRADSSMNGIFYPFDEVKESFNQLEDLPAPLGHPKIEGEHVSASNNFARGKFDIGAFVRNVSMRGKEVHGEIFIDKEVAERTEQGRNLLQKIANKAKIGVSTGLTIARTLIKEGVDELGKAFNRIGEGFQFDHLALLDGEAAAGEHAGTEIIFNGEQSLFVINHEEGGQPNSNHEDDSMKIELDVSDLAKADRVKLESMTANELINAVNAEAPEVTIAKAQAVIEAKGMLMVNAAESVVLSKADHEALKVNADKFAEAETKRLDEIKEKITANSEFETVDLEGMSETQLKKLSASLTPTNDYSMLGSVTTNADQAGTVEVDYS